MTSQEVRIKELITAVGTDWKNIWSALGDMDLDTSASDLTGAINEILGIAGGSLDLDDLTDVVLTGPTTAHLLRHNGTNWVNVLGTTYFDAAGAAASAEAASQPLDSDLTAIAALTTTSYGRAFLALANQAGLMALLASGSETAQGILELATNAETVTGTDTVRATHAAGVKAAIDAAVAALVNSAPGLLDTLDEIAAALGDDPNFAATITTSLAGKQPLDSDLTAIAALTTTSYGRAFLALADQAALMALVIAASETAAGKIELATQTEVNAGSDAVRAVTPATLAYRLGLLRLDSLGGVDVTSAAPNDFDFLYYDATTTSWRPVSGTYSAPTEYGIGLLAALDAGSLASDISDYLPSASEVGLGKIEIATQTETNTGTDDVRAITPLKFQTRLAAYSQPLDSDLTSIAALTTTLYGRALLTLANQAALTAALANASETLPGIIEIATQTETNTGTDDARAVTPLKLASHETTVFGTIDTDYAAYYTAAKA